MLSYKSFVDLLFILLLSTIVMLTQSVQLGAVDTAVAELGAGSISKVTADQVDVVAVGDDGLQLEGTPYETIEALAGKLGRDRAVLLVTLEQDVRHHRVLQVWSELAERGFDVKLGARPKDEPANGGVSEEA